MKSKLITSALLMLVVLSSVYAQDETERNEVQTIFKGNRLRSSTGYGAITNKFTKLNGHYANIVEMYGGWYLNHSFLLGLGGAAVTNNIPVPEQYKAITGRDLSYQYGQFGLVTEYVLGSNRAVHVVFHMMTGAGFTVQYDRHSLNEQYDYVNEPRDENWFVVAEPEIQVELNLLKWMRISPGISYRATFGSNAPGLKDKDLSGMSANITMKFGKF